MLFNSIQYIVFLSLIFIVYWEIPSEKRNILLLFGSYFFYMCWDARFVFLIFAITLVTYFSALGIKKFDRLKYKKIILFISCFSCVGILFVFKYFDFAISIINSLCSLSHILRPNIKSLSLVLPVGISFFTFQSMSYVIDVYNNKTDVEYSFIIYALYVSFFPQLVAGPIERSSNLIPQIRNDKTFDYDRSLDGLRLIIWGLLKKIAIADIAAKYVDAIYGHLNDFVGISLWIAILLFTVQIYCDFSGYTDIARGSAQLFGVSLMDNFISPYFSLTLKEYWTKWHISLSSWFRDYVYIPLGGNKYSKLRRDLNLMITFLASGLWHGANWTFIIWGAIHGFSLILENHVYCICKKKSTYLAIIRNNTFKRLEEILVKCIRMVAVFSFVNFSWVLFRSKSISDVIYFFSHLFENDGRELLIYSLYEKKEIIIFLMNVLLLILYDYIHVNFGNPIDVFKRIPLIGRVLIGYLIIFDILSIVFISGGNNQFVYFQF